MILVVSDSSPLHYLVLIDAIGVLPHLFEKVIVPPAVIRELSNPSAPDPVRTWASNLPAWIQICSPSAVILVNGLGAGESEAISLTLELGLSDILIDERRGRAAALTRLLFPIGILSILVRAHNRKLLNFHDYLARLKATNFRVSPEVILRVEQMLSKDT